MNGKFITIEGIEGAGKSTAIKFIEEYLRQANKDIVVTREPGGTPFAENIRQLLLNPKIEEEVDPKTELLLMFASRAQHLSQLILPALAQNKWVVSDRFVDATYAYQSAGRGIDAKWISLIEDFVVGTLRPNATILLDIDPALGLARSKKRGPQDRFEQEKVEFFDKVRAAYLERAHQDKNRFHIINAGLPLLDVQNQLKRVLEKLV
ncbi:MAG TPA: dTMP kinase [Gammaproteobacteria bacterium]|nr:dTMP kinase [Gammaproteobacteria bacterium]